MPPRTRGIKSAKALKENIGTVDRIKHKLNGKVGKAARKVLADKTNSASDENASIDDPKQGMKHASTLKLKKPLSENQNLNKLRRERRSLNRLNVVEPLKILSNSKENSPTHSTLKSVNINSLSNPIVSESSNESHISAKDDLSLQTTLKTPANVGETSLVAARPRRVCRLPSRFQDHSISPNKFIPVQPSHASTPLAQKYVKSHIHTKNPADVSKKSVNNKSNTSQVGSANVSSPKKEEKIKVASDSNNNAKGRTLRSRKIVEQRKSELKENESKEEGTKNTCISNISSSFKSYRKTINSPVQNANPTKKKSPVKSSNPSSPINSLKTSLRKNSAIKNIPVKNSIALSSSPPKTRARKKPVLQLNKSPIKGNKTVITKSSVNISGSNLSPLKTSPKKKKQSPVNKNFSFKILEDNKKNDNDLDVYEFTYDPNEEPAPKKKKKRIYKKRPTKPKMVILKNNYNHNVNKALTALKDVVSKKPQSVTKTTQSEEAVSKKPPQSVTETTQSNTIIPEIKVTDFDVVKQTGDITETQENTMTNLPNIQRDIASKIIITNPKSPTEPSKRNNVKNQIHIQQNISVNIPQKQHVTSSLNNAANINGDSFNTCKALGPNKSIRVEDIAADFELDIDYSPVNSPARPRTPLAQISRSSAIPYDNDPLNLRENMSFFEQNPVASSSMNTSVRGPQPSPWRVEFESLPIRWHVNSYVKPNMTPAVECSFVNFEDKNRKKHVYTNLVPESNEPLPEIPQKDQGYKVQTSMFQFIKQVVEKSSAKKNKGRSVTPVTASLFNDTKNKTPTKDIERITRSTRQLFTPKKNDKPSTTVDNNNSSEDRENSKDSSRGKKRKNDEQVEIVPAKAPHKEKEDTCFGFDDSDNLDQENASPTKKIDDRKRALRPRARAVLKEINEQGPTRGIIPLAAKTALNAEVERLYEEMKSASDAPVFPEKEQINIGTTNVVEASEELNEDSQPSVHLFEDIEDVVHHLKPQRKSYGKAKKVTFRQISTNSDSEDEVIQQSDKSDADDDLDDLTFNPAVPILEEKKRKKKLTKKQKLSKKEEQEAEAWAAGFNSMCEDVEEFPLVIE